MTHLLYFQWVLCIILIPSIIELNHVNASNHRVHKENSLRPRHMLPGDMILNSNQFFLDAHLEDEGEEYFYVTYRDIYDA